MNRRGFLFTPAAAICGKPGATDEDFTAKAERYIEAMKRMELKLEEHAAWLSARAREQ
jgi:hypothetical protein